MSVSDNSTLPVARESEGSYQLLDGHAYGVGDLSVNSYDKSPYVDPEIISLDVGPSQTRYRVHRAVLSQSPELDAKPALKLWGEKTNDTIPLPELDEITAHTLVHYLYTGKYQSLQAYDQAEKSVLPRYKLGTCVYCAAVRYKLGGLAELAKEKITSFGEDLTILDILSVARDHAFPVLPDDEAWFPAYIEDAIKSAVSEDPGLFMKPGFVDQIEGDRKFRQVVMKAIVNTYSNAPSISSPRQSEVPASVSEMSLEQSAQTNVPKPIAPTPQPDAPVTSSSVTNGNVEPKEKMITPPAVKDDVMKLDEIDPTVEPQGLEQFTDETGYGNSKTYQKLGKKPDSPVDPKTTIDTLTTKPAHTRSDSVMQVVEPLPGPVSAPVVEEKKVTSPEPVDASPLVVDGTNGNTTPSKKNKKKNKKKGSSTTATATTATTATTAITGIN